MDIARCTLNNETYTAVDFSNLPAGTIENLRVHLICVECNNPAFYRRKTRDGRAPCFGGRPHKTTCPLAVAGAGAWGVDGPDDEDARTNSEDAIVLDLRLDVQGADDAPGGNPSQLRRGRGRTFGNEGAHQTRSHRRLRSILRMLIKVPGFRHSTQMVEVPTLVTARVCELFLNFNDIRSQHIGQFRAFWGTLSDARQSNETVWLNTGGPAEPSIPVSNAELPDTLSLARATDLEDLAGAYVLVLGRLEQSANWKKFITFTDPTRVAIILYD